MRTNTGSFETIGISCKAVQSKYVMDIPDVFCDKDGNECLKTTLEGVIYIKSYNFLLCSLARLMQQGWKMSSDQKAIEVAKGSHTITFHIMIPTPKDAIYAGCFKQSKKIAMVSTQSGFEMNIQEAHTLLRHIDEEMTQVTAKVLG